MPEPEKANNKPGTYPHSLLSILLLSPLQFVYNYDNMEANKGYL
jgi:hypothetical protein